VTELPSLIQMQTHLKRFKKGKVQERKMKILKEALEDTKNFFDIEGLIDSGFVSQDIKTNGFC